MTPALLESPLSQFAERGCGRSAGGGEITLEKRLEAVWRAVRAEGGAACPVCHAPMQADGDAARCTGCGSMLS